jgi:RNA polymerase sigma-70 factor (ECF subfamily)
MAMATAAGAPDRDFEAYRPYLHLLARLQVPRFLQARVDLSGVVQMTLFEAHRSRAGLRAQEPSAWLRRILVHNLTDELRKLGAGKRGGGRERSLEQALSESSSRLEALLAADQSSPEENLSGRNSWFAWRRCSLRCRKTKPGPWSCTT